MERNSNRPISPHLQVYKLPSTGVASIFHRITGVLLSFGLILLVRVLTDIARGPDSFADLQAALRPGVVQVLYWGFVFALFFHTCHGIRHLIWDAGFGFERGRLNRDTLVELAASVILTLGALIYFS